MRRFGVESAVAPLVLAIAIATVHGQDQRGQPAGAAPAVQRPPETGPSAGADSKNFVNDMAIAGMAEVQLGNLATERAASSDVKAFGQMMASDHSKANEELKQVASQLTIQMPTQLDQKHRGLAEKLSKLQGAEFDREYMTAMVQGHQEVLGKLKARAGAPGAANAPGEPALAQWATKAVPTVQQHLERARDLRQKLTK